MTDFMFSNSLKSVFKKVCRVDPLTDENLPQYFDLVDDIYPRPQFTEMNDSSRLTVEYGNGLSTLLMVNDVPAGFCVAERASIDDVTEEMEGLVSPEQEQVILESVRNGELAYITDFGIKKDISSGFLLYKYLKEIVSLFKSVGIRYVVSNFRESSSMKLLDLLVGSNQAQRFADLVYRQDADDEDVLEMDDEPFPFGVIKLNNSVRNLWTKLSQSEDGNDKQRPVTLNDEGAFLEEFMQRVIKLYEGNEIFKRTMDFVYENIDDTDLVGAIHLNVYQEFVENIDNFVNDPDARNNVKNNVLFLINQNKFRTGDNLNRFYHLDMVKDSDLSTLDAFVADVEEAYIISDENFQNSDIDSPEINQYKAFLRETLKKKFYRSEMFFWNVAETLSGKIKRISHTIDITGNHEKGILGRDLLFNKDTKTKAIYDQAVKFQSLFDRSSSFVKDNPQFIQRFSHYSGFFESINFVFEIFKKFGIHDLDQEFYELPEIIDHNRMDMFSYNMQWHDDTESNDLFRRSMYRNMPDLMRNVLETKTSKTGQIDVYGLIDYLENVQNTTYNYETPSSHILRTIKSFFDNSDLKKKMADMGSEDVDGRTFEDLIIYLKKAVYNGTFSSEGVDLSAIVNDPQRFWGMLGYAYRDLQWKHNFAFSGVTPDQLEYKMGEMVADLALFDPYSQPEETEKYWDEFKSGYWIDAQKGNSDNTLPKMAENENCDAIMKYVKNNGYPYQRGSKDGSIMGDYSVMVNYFGWNDRDDYANKSHYMAQTMNSVYRSLSNLNAKDYARIVTVNSETEDDASKELNKIIYALGFAKNVGLKYDKLDEEKVAKINALKPKDILNEFMKMYTIVDLPQDGTIRKRLMTIGRNYISALNPYNRTHIGWNNFLAEFRDQFRELKTLLADNDIYNMDLKEISEIFRRRKDAMAALGSEYRDKVMVIKKYIIDHGFEEKYRPEEIQNGLASGGLEEEDVDNLKMMYQIDRFNSPDLGKYMNFMSRVRSVRKGEYGGYDEGAQFIPSGPIEIDGYVFEITQKDDPINIMLGNITSCCQTIGGEAEDCVLDGMTNPYAGFLIVYPKSKDGERRIIAQSYVWMSVLSDGVDEYAILVLDNIETVGGGNFDLARIQDGYKKWAEKIKEIGNFKEVHVGMGYGNVRFERIPKNEESTIEKIMSGKTNQDTYTDADSEMKRIAGLSATMRRLAQNLIGGEDESAPEAVRDDNLQSIKSRYYETESKMASLLEQPDIKQRFYHKMFFEQNSNAIKKSVSNYLHTSIGEGLKTTIRQDGIPTVESALMNIALELWSRTYPYSIDITPLILDGNFVEKINSKISDDFKNVKFPNNKLQDENEYYETKQLYDSAIVNEIRELFFYEKDIMDEVVEYATNDALKNIYEIFMGDNPDKSILTQFLMDIDYPNSHMINNLDNIKRRLYGSYINEVFRTQMMLHIWEIIKFIGMDDYAREIQNVSYDYFNDIEENRSPYHISHINDVLLEKHIEELKETGKTNWNHLIKTLSTFGSHTTGAFNMAMRAYNVPEKESHTFSGILSKIVRGYGSSYPYLSDIDLNFLNNKDINQVKNLEKVIDNDDGAYYHYLDALQFEGPIYEFPDKYDQQVQIAANGDWDHFKAAYFIDNNSDRSPIENILRYSLGWENAKNKAVGVMKYCYFNQLSEFLNFDSPSGKIHPNEFEHRKQDWLQQNKYDPVGMQMPPNRPNIVAKHFSRLSFDKSSYMSDYSHNGDVKSSGQSIPFLRYMTSSTPKDIALKMLLQERNEDNISALVNDFSKRKKDLLSFLELKKDYSVGNVVALDDLYGIKVKLSVEDVDEIIQNIDGLKESHVLDEIMKMYTLPNINDKTLRKRLMTIGKNYIRRLHPDNLNHVNWNSFLYKHRNEIGDIKTLLADSDVYQLPLDTLSYLISLRKKAMNKFGSNYKDTIAFLKEYSLTVGFDDEYPEIDEYIKDGYIDQNDVDVLKMIYGIDKSNSPDIRKFADFMDKIRDRHNVRQKIRPNSFDINGYTFEITRKDDDVNIMLGYITNCCQSISGEAEGCVIDGIMNPSAGFMIVYPTGKRDQILAQSYIWESYGYEEGGGIGGDNYQPRPNTTVLVLDNIEISGVNPKFDINEMKNNYKQWSEYMKSSMGYDMVVMGIGYNDLNFDFPELEYNDHKKIMDGKTEQTYTDARDGIKQLAITRVPTSLIRLSSNIKEAVLRCSA